MMLDLSKTARERPCHGRRGRYALQRAGRLRLLVPRPIRLRVSCPRDVAYAFAMPWRRWPVSSATLVANVGQCVGLPIGNIRVVSRHVATCLSRVAT